MSGSQLRLAVLSLLIAATGPLSASGQDKKRKVPVEFGFHNSMLRQIRPVWLLAEKAVRDDLKVTDAQAKKLPAVRLAVYKKRANWDHVLEWDDEVWPLAVREMAATVEKELLTVLTAAQLKRLKQISLQVYDGTYMGLYDIVRRPDLAKDFQLTDRQKEGLADLRKGLSASRLKVSNNPGNRRVKQEHVEYVKATDEKVKDLLTAAQKATLKDLIGDEFKGEVHPPGR